MPTVKSASANRTSRAARPGTKVTAAETGKRRSVTLKRQAATGSSKRSSARRSGKATSSAAPAGERAYRRMPNPDEVLDAYRQVGTVSGLAEHFGVPRHTVQGWARRLRREGHTIGGRS